MLTVSNIRESVEDIVVKYPIKKISLFGFYADGNANEEKSLAAARGWKLLKFIEAL